MKRERKIAYQTLSVGQHSGLVVLAPSIQRLFIDSALSLCDYRITLDLVQESEKQTLEVSGQSLSELYLAWLNAVAGLFPNSHFLPHRIVFTHFDGKKLNATLMGEKYHSPRHGFARPFSKILNEHFRIGESESAAGEFEGRFVFALD
jgi:SHS2 domain-containing protein